PELHDKIEFEVAQTATDFCSSTSLRERCGDVLSRADLEQFETALRRLTAAAMASPTCGTLRWAVAVSERADGKLSLWESDAASSREDRRDAGLRHRAFALLRGRGRQGPLPSGVVPRPAFIAGALGRSAGARGAFAPDRLDAFRSSIPTVARALAV